MILSWYEQKAVAVLLTLLHLGIQGIRLKPEAIHIHQDMDTVLCI
jgi:hydroxylamine reductase (hybrid-cluster protein)